MGKPEGSRPLGRLIVCDRIILKWINVKWGGGRKWTGSIQLKTETGGCMRPSCGRNLRSWTFVSRESCSFVPGAGDQDPKRTAPRPRTLLCRWQEALMWPGCTRLRSFAGFEWALSPTWPPKGPLQWKRCQRFGHTQRGCGYAPRCVACGEAHLSGGCSTSKEQLKCCSCGENHTVIYRGCGK